MPEWTDEQLSAINARGRSVVVSAAAGSGKTAVLVEKLRRMLCDEENKVSADSVAVVTFTNDAAAQMKQRLRVALRDEFDRTGSVYISEQLSLLPSAKISTIHSFCFDLIRQYPEESGADPDFTVLSPEDSEIISQKAADEVYERWFAEREKDIDLLCSFFFPGSKRIDDFTAMLFELKEKILSQRFPKEYMQRIIKVYGTEPCDSFIFKSMRKKMSDSLSDAAEMFKIAADGIRKISAGRKIPLKPGDVKKLSLMDDAINDLKIASKKVLSDNEYIPEIAVDPIKSVPKYLKDAVPEDIQRKIGGIELLLNEGAALLDKYCIQKKSRGDKKGEYCFLPEEIRDDFSVHEKICTLLFELLGELIDRESEMRTEKNSLNFSDAEQIACRLLCRRDENGRIVKTPIANALSEKYKIVMIDEFQDSTDIQELIFKLLSKDGTETTPGTNFFAVGDVKQSIYRFRSSDPRLFLKNIKESVPYADDGKTTPSHIFLNKNFRSSRYVIDFANYIFERLMTAQNGGVVYNSDHFLIRGANQQDDFGPVEIINIVSKITTAEEIRKAEAKAVAKRIKGILTQTIHENGIERKILPSDICILARNTKAFGIYADALAEEGIASSCGKDNKCLYSGEVMALTDMLRVIDNPTRDVPLTAALMSPLFMLTAADMGYIRFADRMTSDGHGDGGIFRGIIGIVKNEDIGGLIPEGTIKKCRRFYEEYTQFRKYALSHSIEELIRYICKRCDYLSSVTIGDRSGEMISNINIFTAYAAAYDKNGSGGINGFLRQLDIMEEAGKDIKTSAVSMDGAVDIKTIHSSKGLEYPFVFLCDTSHRFNLSVGKVMFCSDMGAAFSINSIVKGAITEDPGEIKVYGSFPGAAAAEEIKKSQRDEEVMLLYVALTRAKYKTIITMSNKKSAEKISAASEILVEQGRQDIASGLGSSYEEWLGGVLTPPVKCELEEKGLLKIISSSELEDRQEENEEEISAENEQSAVETERAKREFERHISRKYDDTLSRMLAKHTVTELAKKPLDPESRLFAPTERKAAVKRIKGVTAAERGSAVHVFMQHFDMARLLSAKQRGERAVFAFVKEEAKRIADMGIISCGQAESIYPPLIGAFADSMLFKRMADSGEIIREKKFLVKISDLNLDGSGFMGYNGTEGMLQGVADCIFRENDGYVLVDYKTDSLTTPEELVRRYALQLRLYAAAFSLILECPVKKAYIYSFSLGSEIEVDID